MANNYTMCCTFILIGVTCTVYAVMAKAVWFMLLLEPLNCIRFKRRNIIMSASRNRMSVIWKSVGLMLASAAVFAGCATRPVVENDGSAGNAHELLEKSNIYEVIAHLYRWHLDEVDVYKSTRAGNKTVWIREIYPVLDKDDKSVYAEMFLPVIDVRVLLKKADYSVPEIGLKVKSDHFVVTRINRTALPQHLNRDFVPVKLDGKELRDYLFARRGTVVFPDDELIDRLRDSVRDEIVAHLKDKNMEAPKGDLIVHFSPISPVANEVWAFWEYGRVLIRFSADMSLSDKSAWEHEKLMTDLYDIDDQVVVSMQEVPGSNAYMTRDQVGRALYNCIILGRRYELKPRTK
jgi:hypothetical protein